jgi:hypothetical protein
MIHVTIDRREKTTRMFCILFPEALLRQHKNNPCYKTSSKHRDLSLTRNLFRTLRTPLTYAPRAAQCWRNLSHRI